jgi:hypothetical protein
MRVCSRGFCGISVGLLAAYPFGMTTMDPLVCGVIDAILWLLADLVAPQLAPALSLPVLPPFADWVRRFDAA